MKYTLLAVVFAVVCAVCGPVWAQSFEAAHEPIYMIDSPNAGMLGHGEYHIKGSIGPESAILLSSRIGIRNILQLGVSFGMQEVFSYEEVTVNDHVGFRVRFRLIGEDEIRPAFAIGFDSQGSGKYIEDMDRYERKSRGFYAVVSRNWETRAGQWSFHGGVNYSMERQDEDDTNVFAAVDWEVISGLEFILDADAAFNDNEDETRFGGGGIYLDGAVRVTYGENLTLMLIFRDITENFRPQRRIGREFEVAFVDFF